MSITEIYWISNLSVETYIYIKDAGEMIFIFPSVPPLPAVSPFWSDQLNVKPLVATGID